MNEYLIYRNILRENKSSNLKSYQFKSNETSILLKETCIESMKLININLKQIHIVLNREMILFERIIYRNKHQHHNAKYYKRMKQVYTPLFILLDYFHF